MKQIGNKIIQLDSVDSTNNFVANMLKLNEIVHGTVILADEQYAGRGQRGAEWHSQAGLNLICSIFIEHDNLSVTNQPALTHWVSLSVVELLKKLNIDAQIKWPNDILVNDKKICGILIENQLNGGTIKSSILGVGLNVNQLVFGEFNATSIQQLTGEHQLIRELAFSLIQRLNELAELLERPIELKLKYTEKLWKINELVHFTEGQTVKSGVIIGTSESGLLLIQSEGDIKSYDLKEIVFNY